MPHSYLSDLSLHVWPCGNDIILSTSLEAFILIIALAQAWCILEKSICHHFPYKWFYLPLRSLCTVCTLKKPIHRHLPHN